jgi:hypothetical protein
MRDAEENASQPKTIRDSGNMLDFVLFQTDKFDGMGLKNARESP